MKINNAADLNLYYNNTVTKETNKDKSDKTRLIIVKDKDGEHLEAKKLTLGERICALFGGKASFSRVVEFCNDKNIHSEGLANLVTSYNKQHQSKPISYSYMIPGTEMIVANFFEAGKEAIEKGNFQPLKPILTSEFAKNTENHSKLTELLNKADAAGLKDLAKEIVKHLDIKHIENLLCSGCRDGNSIRTGYIIRHREDLDLNKKEANFTPLMHAAAVGRLEVVRQLLASDKVDPMIGDAYVGDPLLLAIRNNHPEVVRALVADKRVAITPEKLLSHIDEVKENKQLRALLCSEKCTSAVNAKGKTALMLALEQGKVAIAKDLLHTTKLDVKDNEGNTALLCACMKYNIPLEERKALITELLSKAPEQVLHRNKIGLDALDYSSDILEVFEAFAKSGQADSAEIGRRLELIKSAQYLKANATSMVAQLKDARKAMDLPPLADKKPTALLDAFRKACSGPDPKHVLARLDPKERTAILFDLARTSKGPSLDEAKLLIKEKEEMTSFPFAWLKRQLDKLPPFGPDKKASEARLVSIGKIFMQACEEANAKNYAEIVKKYPEFV